MNRIILIGNGFDLAHGMKTSYRDFIDDYWERFREDIQENRITEIGYNIYENKHKCIKVQIPYKLTSESLEDDIIEFKGLYEPKIYAKLTYNNKFFEQICKHISDKSWVDIENEYYEKLKKCDSDQAKVLNEEFKVIEELLERYLIKVEEDINASIFSKIKDKIYSAINLKDIPESCEIEFIKSIISKAERIRKLENTETSTKIKHWVEKLTKATVADTVYSISGQTDPNKISLIKKNVTSLPSELISPNDILFLNFNYTHTHQQYISEKSDFQTIHIHGELNNPNNPMIFGYGDELAEDYKQIENLNNNEYLKNVKSIRYLETDNYRRLLSFIESESYQIFIMGHSCGNSDRTLLNTLFEHKNCVSIKPFFHKRENGSNNYNEIVQNISRNFTNKAIMRERVVNKMYCEPLS